MVSYVNEVDILIDFVKKLKPKTTLEVGCNFGRELSTIEGLTKAYGIDQNEEFTQRKDNIICANGEDIPYKNNKFDLIYTDGCLSHNKEPEIILDEMIRVSKKYILLIEWIGSKTGTGYSNVKEGISWIHDYEFLISGKDIKVLFNRRIPCRADLFHVILLQKDKLKTKIIERVETKEVEKKSKFSISLGKYKLEI